LIVGHDVKNLLIAGFVLGRHLRKGNTTREQEKTPLSKITRGSQELFTRIVYALNWYVCTRVHMCVCTGVPLLFCDQSHWIA